MKKLIFSLLMLFLLFPLSTFAQNHTKYLQQGENFFNKMEYLDALERFDLAYEFAKNTSEKNKARAWKSKSKQKIKEQQENLKIALKEARKEKEKALLAKEIAIKAQKEAKYHSLKAQSLAMSVVAREELNSNPSRAIRLAELAYDMTPDFFVFQTICNAYYRLYSYNFRFSYTKKLQIKGNVSKAIEITAGTNIAET